MAYFPAIDPQTFRTTRIVETSANQMYRVAEIPQAGMEHCWFGVAIKRGKIRGTYVDKTNAKVELVRKAGSRVIR